MDYVAQLETISDIFPLSFGINRFKLELVGFLIIVLLCAKQLENILLLIFFPFLLSCRGGWVNLIHLCLTLLHLLVEYYVVRDPWGFASDPMLEPFDCVFCYAIVAG